MGNRSKEYLRNRDIAFEQKGLNPNDKRYNCHHIYFKSDLKRGLLPPDFEINAVENLDPLLVRNHDALHQLVDSNPQLKNDISNRVALARLAEIGQLDDYELPQQRTTAPKKEGKHKRHKHYR